MLAIKIPLIGVKALPQKKEDEISDEISPSYELFDYYEWTKQGFCNGGGIDPNWFFDRLNYAKAKVICRGCPVKKNCLVSGLIYGEEGVWGGTDDDERKWYQPELIEYLISQAKSFHLYFPRPSAVDSVWE
jgi:hypothetical protein